VVTLYASRRVVSVTETMITCPKCGEVQSNRDYLCARCGASLETAEQRKQRLHELEMSRRAAERNDVSIQRITGSVNGNPRASFFSQQFFSEMSNQMRRRYAYVFGGITVAVLVMIFTKP
jgi:DNA-directed RNA polymerase subunit RPC12/RpoP